MACAVGTIVYDKNRKRGRKKIQAHTHSYIADSNI